MSAHSPDSSKRGSKGGEAPEREASAQAPSAAWGGRFADSVSNAMRDFHSSIHFDQRLYREDIEGSIAHATMLGEQGLLSKLEAGQLIHALRALIVEIEAGTATFDPAAEDIHMNVEKLLVERLGDLGKKLHTARSRNDQVALDLRLHLRAAIDRIQSKLTELTLGLCGLAETHLDALMPGYTHLQGAQPITLAHHLMAYASMFERDLGRLKDARRRLNVSPLGSGALATTGFPLDRKRVAEILRMDGVTANSLDAVSDRDFGIEFLSAAAILMMHLSRFCEELILWSSAEFGYVELSDGYSTGSSMMPQKKNPDAAELIRGKTGRVYGDLISLLTVMKGLPLAYNKDLQEDKEAVFDAIDTLEGCLSVFWPMLESAAFKTDRMRERCEDAFLNATDLADFLVSHSVPFRDAHEITGKIVRHAIEKKHTLSQISPQIYQGFHAALGTPEMFNAIRIETCVAKRSLEGGPARVACETAIQSTRKRLMAS